MKLAQIMNVKKWGLFALILVLAVGIAVGCGSDTTTDVDNEGQGENVEENGNASEEGTEQATDDAFPVTIVDYTGEEVTIESEPQTIVSLVPSNTETLFALGLEDKIIGVSDFCDYPAETQDKEKLGGQEINEEVVLSLLPDMAVVTNNHHDNEEQRQVLDRFREAGITVVVINTSADSFDHAYNNILLMGEATGKSAKAEEIVTGMKEHLAEIVAKVEAEVTEPRTVFVEVWFDPIYTPGQGTFMDDMLTTLNAINVIEEEGWPSISEEVVVAANPDVIVMNHTAQTVEEVLQRSGWGEVPAVKNEHVKTVDQNKVSRPGPRLIHGVEEFAKAIYPEIFND